MTSTHQQDNLDTLLTALAVAGEADPPLLGLILEQRLDEQVVAQLCGLPGITRQNGILGMAQEAAATRLKALEENDFLHFRHLHQRAATILAERLCAGNAAAEAALMRVFTRLAEHLRLKDPTKLPELIEATRLAPLKLRHNQHYHTYMQGIALQQTGQYDALLQLCNTLIVQPDLALELRGRTHNLRATSYYFLGRLQQALDDYRMCLAIMEQTGHTLNRGIVLQNMGALAYDLQDYDEAERRLRQAEQIFAAEASTEWLAAVQNELGLVYRDQGKWAEAHRCFADFIVKSREHGAHDDVAIGLLNLGEALLLQGRLEEAETTLHAALETMSTDAFRIDLLLNLGMIRQMHADLGNAKHYYQEALTLTGRLERRFMLAAVHYRLAHLCRQESDGQGTLRHLLAGIEAVEETRAPLREEGLKINLLGRWQQLYEEAVLLLIEQKRFADAFHYVERARSRAFLDLLAGTTTAGATEEPATISMLQEQLPEDAALVEFFATGLPGPFAPMLANMPQEAQFLRDYLLPPERLLAFVVTQKVVQVVELDAGAHQIGLQHFQRSDGRLRGVLPLPGQRLRPLSRWYDLGHRLLSPLQPYLTGKRQLFFVPHGVLHYLPLHALLDVAQLTGDAQTTVSYAPSASILFKRSIAPTPATARRGKHVALAIGVNGTGLQHAEDEAKWLAGRLRGDALLGAQATRAAVRAALTGYDVIHFSCHGHFRRRNPLESALALADGELTAADLFQVGSLPADLITLSACDTGLNQLHPGDELMGLTRAFLGCGTRSLLVTLWPVHEVPTRILIEQFYSAWSEGMPKARALLEAQRHLVQMEYDALERRLAGYGLSSPVIAEHVALFHAMLPGSHPFAHPYYWGAFLLIGAQSRQAS